MSSTSEGNAGEPVRILGVAGSLRQYSFNRGLLRAALELVPEGAQIEVYEIGAIPLYNGDVEAQGDPQAVQDWKAHIRGAAALLIATPEYNYSIPGVLKNAIDWASRPAPNSVLLHKPIALMGATSGIGATIRAQLALRQVFVFTRSYVLPPPEVLVNNARTRFDERGNLTDEETRRFVRALLEALVDWTRRLQVAGLAPRATSG